jgi:hypothetical protein
MKTSLKIAALMVAALAVTATAASAETMSIKRQYTEVTGAVISVAETAAGVYSVSTREPLVAGYTGTMGQKIIYRIRAEGETGSNADKYAYQAIGEFEQDETSKN